MTKQETDSLSRGLNDRATHKIHNVFFNLKDEEENITFIDNFASRIKCDNNDVKKLQDKLKNLTFSKFTLHELKKAIKTMEIVKMYLWLYLQEKTLLPMTWSVISLRRKTEQNSKF